MVMKKCSIRTDLASESLSLKKLEDKSLCFFDVE